MDVLLVGLGRWGEKHLRVLRGLGGGRWGAAAAPARRGAAVPGRDAAAPGRGAPPPPRDPLLRPVRAPVRAPRDARGGAPARLSGPRARRPGGGARRSEERTA